jgi:hypothetical protein
MTQSKRGRAAPARQAARLTLASILALAVLAIMSAVSGANGGPASFTVNADGNTIKFHVEALADTSDLQATDFSLNAGGSRKFDVKLTKATAFKVTASGAKITDITCSPQDPDPEDAFHISVSAGTAVIELSPGENKQCTFKTETPSKPTPKPPSKPTPKPPSKPGGGVLPQRNVAAHARMHAPTACVSRAYTIAVTGGPIRRVTFFLNGKKARTVAARSGQRRFTAHLGSGTSNDHVTAKVTFKSNARPRARTLRATIRHCARQVVAPQFTG